MPTGLFCFKLIHLVALANKINQGLIYEHYLYRQTVSDGFSNKIMSGKWKLEDEHFEEDSERIKHQDPKRSTREPTQLYKQRQEIPPLRHMGCDDKHTPLPDQVVSYP